MSDCLSPENGFCNQIVYGSDEIQNKAKDNNSSVHNEINMNNIHAKSSEKREDNLETLIRKYMSGKKLPDNFYKLTHKEQKQWLHEKLKLTIKVLPDSVINLTVGFTYDGDCGNSLQERPNWLDIEKFRKGQKFARDNFFGLSYAMLLSMYIPFSFEDGLKPIIITGKSNTPFLAFKRYTSTTLRVRNWYTEDPWTKGTAAYNDIQIVRKMHANVRKKLKGIKNENVDAATKMNNPYCPTREILLKDFQSSCSPPLRGQCPYMLFQSPEFVHLRPKPLNQTDMVVTQFLFFGLVILYPEAFGAHNANVEDLDAFCHTWMGLGYLLGIDDDFNLCRGSLEDIRQRCRDLLEIWTKPNLREMSPEYEHMMRCIMDGFRFNSPGLTYESSLLYLSELLNIHTPRFYSTLSYKIWIMHNLVKLFFYYLSRVPGLMMFVNKQLNDKLDKAAKYSLEKYERVRQKLEKDIQNARKDAVFYSFD